MARGASSGRKGIVRFGVVRGASVLLGLTVAAVSAVAEDCVYLDEEDLRARFAGNGRTSVCTNGEEMVGGAFSRGVCVHSPSALCLVMDGRARSFEATFGQLGKPNRSMLHLRVWRDGTLAAVSPELNANR